MRSIPDILFFALWFFRIPLAGGPQTLNRGGKEEKNRTYYSLSGGGSFFRVNWSRHTEQETPVLTTGIFHRSLLIIDYDIPHGRSGVSAMMPDGYPGDDTLMAEPDIVRVFYRFFKKSRNCSPISGSARAKSTMVSRYPSLSPVS